MATHDLAVLRRLLDLGPALGRVRGTDAVLRTVLDAARELTGARYAAIGVPDGDGGFELFLTAGVDQQTWDRIGALPRTHGLLGAMLTDAEPIRLPDIRADPRFQWWPAAHPRMRAFLGVPIVAGGEVVAALYLTDPPAGPEPQPDPGPGPQFSAEDQEIVEALAAQAALAVVNAQRTERTRELSIAQERARLARDLHDSVTQTLFSLSLAAETATALGPADPRTAAELDRVRVLAATAQDELRRMVDTLRPADPGEQALVPALRRRIDLLRRVHDVDIALVAPGLRGARRAALDGELFMVATEALSNALQHSGAAHVTVTVQPCDTGLRLTVADDGRGFDAPAGDGHLGLVSMRERMEAVGGVLRVSSTVGDGTTVTAEVPGG